MIDNVLFPLMLERFVSAPEFSTTIIATGNGAEQRIANWEDARITFNAALGVRSRKDVQTLLNFFRARKGRLRGFLVRDMLDYKADGDVFGVGDGVTKEFQLVRVYTDAVGANITAAYGKQGNTDIRPIYKPEPNSVQIYSGVSALQQGGYGATATATVNGSGAISAVTVTNGGAGYTSAPTVSFSVTGSGAQATSVIVNGAVAAISVISQGFGYLSAPTITVSGGGGSGATATAVMSDDRVSSIVVTNGGSGYTSAPTVTITPKGSGATATATVASGAVTAVSVSSGGTGYTAASVKLVNTANDYSVDYKTGKVVFKTAPSNGAILSWTGRFYIPCRFAEDKLPADELFYDVIDDAAAGNIPDVVLVETRDFE